jgi:hypothetical protein
MELKIWTRQGMLPKCSDYQPNKYQKPENSISISIFSLA